MTELSENAALRAAVETVRAHGVEPDRCDVLQDGHTLVVRLTESLVVRVVQAVEGARQGTEWFARETALARHLTECGAPVVPLHPHLPQHPLERDGFPMNFWRWVAVVDEPPREEEIGRTLRACHEALRTFAEPLPHLAIVHESLRVLEQGQMRGAFDAVTAAMLRGHLAHSLDELRVLPAQPLHGDSHAGNMMNTEEGLLWADWEDAFAGPVEWDVASIIWNARILENDEARAAGIVAAYRAAGGVVDEVVLDACLVARAAVMSAWYPELYPNPDAERRRKLECRLAWLRQRTGAQA